MNQLPKKKIAKFFSPEYDKLWMILLPCLAICCCILILAPQLSALAEYARAKRTPAEQEMPAKRTVTLSASSYERDMHIIVRDESGNIASGERFALVVTSPDGNTAEYETRTDGSCYIVELSAGEYTIGVADASDYTAAPVKCIVTDGTEHGSYTYTVSLGPNGYILYRGTDRESDVLPVDENGDNIPEYGIRYEPASQTDLTDDGASSENGGHYISVALFNADNTPVELYAIDAVPLVPKSDESGGDGTWKSENGRTYYYDGSGRKATGLKKIDGRFYFFNEYGEMARSVGIDVSCFNGSIDWEAVKAQGIDFAVIRIGGRGWSSGRVYEDTFMRKYLEGARSAGLDVGVYFYSTAVNTAEAVHEAESVIEKLKNIRLEYPVFIDMEFSGSYPRGRADLLLMQERVRIADAFCRTVMSRGYAAGIYASEYYMDMCMDYPSVSQYTYWLANYTAGGAVPDFSGRYDIWQFTNSGQLEGISGTVDFNAVF